MNNNTQLETTEIKLFPSIKQCFIIVCIITFSSIVFTPITIISKSISIEFIKDISFFLYYLLSFGMASVFIYIYKKHKEQHTYSNPQFRINDFILIPLVMTAVIALQIGVTVPIISLIPMPEFVKSLFDSMSKDMTGFWTLSAVIILAPIFEEYIFRGVMLDGLLKRFSPTKAILISSLFFGLIHFNPWQFVSAMVIGTFAGWIYYRTKNLLLCILIHLANNGWAMLSGYIFANNGEADIYPTNKLVYIIAALAIALACIFILKTRLSSYKLTELEHSADYQENNTTEE